MDQYSQKDFIKLLKKNSQSLRHDFLTEDTDCMRVYDRHQGDFPVTVDLYSNYVRIVDYSDNSLDDDVVSFCISTCSRMLYVPVENVVFVHRAKRLGKEQHEKTEQSLRTTVHESGLEFEVELKKYTDTGLFLDHCLTRKMIREMVQGLDVLNLFSYTGSFSVYAAAGQAKSVTSVDLSSTYTKWAEENLKRNGFSGSPYKCICKDATEFIDEQIKTNTKYDIIIFDPPSFSNSHKMEKDFDVGRDAFVWLKKLSLLLRKDGIILFSTNLGSFKMDKRKLRGLSVQEITDRVMAPGFVKSRKGAVRSWIMTAEDSSLNLDWSEDVKPAEKKSYNRNSGREYSRKDGKEYGKKNYEKKYHPNKEYGRRDYGTRSEFGRNEYKPEFSSHREYRSERTSDRRPSYSTDYADRPRRNYSNSEHRGRYEHSDRNGEPRERRQDRFEHSDRRREGGYQHHDRREGGYERRDSYASRSARTKGPKPYGYDSFKPARSRQEDDPDLFWN